MRRADPHRALLRALAASYPALRVLDGRTEPWASATFTGMRHVLRCEPLDLAGLDDADFTLPGHVVADIAAAEENGLSVIEALTIETD